MLTDQTVRDLLAAFSSSDPTPGGGSAAALASAVGSSLLIMVASLPKTRTGSDEEQTALTAAAATLTGLRDRLTRAIDDDSAAYDQVVAAFKLPKGSPDDQQARKAAVDRALRAATDVPLDVVRLSAGAIDEAQTVATHGNRSAASDVGVAVALLRAGLHGARLNVDINLAGIKDEAYAAAVRGEVDRLSAAAAESAEHADRALAEGRSG
jgi:formiminotetrahydrofolate cyclodeaminase